MENEGKVQVLRQRGVHGSWTNGYELEARPASSGRSHCLQVGLLRVPPLISGIKPDGHRGGEEGGKGGIKADRHVGSGEGGGRKEVGEEGGERKEGGGRRGDPC